MTIAYSWDWGNEALEVQPSTGVVTQVRYILVATDDSTPPLRAVHSGVVSLDAPAAGVAVTPIASLTSHIVAGWVTAKLGPTLVGQLEALLAAQIAKQKNPTQTVRPPWVPAPTAPVAS